MLPGLIPPHSAHAFCQPKDEWLHLPGMFSLSDCASFTVLFIYSVSSVQLRLQLLIILLMIMKLF